MGFSFTHSDYKPTQTLDEPVQTCSRPSSLGPKNRVWDFLDQDDRSHQENHAQPVELHLEIVVFIYNDASGRNKFWNMDTFEGLSEDPISLHKYMYANSNPSSFVDPSGNLTLTESVVIASLIGIIALEGHVAVVRYTDAVNGGFDGISGDPVTQDRLKKFAGPEKVQELIARGVEEYKKGGSAKVVEFFNQDDQARYFYTSKLGWMDLVHVASAAGFRKIVPIPALAQLGGLTIEAEQLLQANINIPIWKLHTTAIQRKRARRSAFRLEDFFSNALGEYWGIKESIPSFLMPISKEKAEEHLK